MDWGLIDGLARLGRHVITFDPPESGRSTRPARLGVLHILWPRLAPQKIMLNLIERHSFHDQSWVEPKNVEWRDWLRPRQGRTDWHRVASKLDYGLRLGEIEAPALILCGRHDPQYPPAASQQLARGIRKAQLIFFDGQDSENRHKFPHRSIA